MKPEGLCSEAKLEARREFYFQWHLTDRCNLQCRHCYEGEEISQELTLPEKMRVIEILSLTMQKWRMKGRVSLTGGEPLLLADFFSVLTNLESIDAIGTINVLTNGTLITNELLSDIPPTDISEVLSNDGNAGASAIYSLAF